MGKVILLKQISALSKQIKSQNQKITVVGGCFDILHIGHIRFLQKAKALADVLIILLESDEKIRLMKGEIRPLNSQKMRAEVLAALRMVDYVVMLPKMMENKDYDVIIKKIKPDFIAVTKGDPNMEFKKRTAKLVGARVVSVIGMVAGYSSEKIIKSINPTNNRWII